MIRGIDVILYRKQQNGEDAFGAPVFNEVSETVHNVLIGEPTTEELVNELQLYGKRLAYTLALPKGDAHDWHDVTVEFFGQRFRTYGDVTEGIEAMIPLRWNRKVKVERYGYSKNRAEQQRFPAAFEIRRNGTNAETASRTGTLPVWKRIQHRFVPSKQPSYSGRICGNGRNRKAKQSRKYVA